MGSGEGRCWGLGCLRRYYSEERQRTEENQLRGMMKLLRLRLNVLKKIPV